MVGDAGPGAWAIKTKDIRAEMARLRSLGIETAGPDAGSRRRPDGKILEWQTASAGPGAAGALLPFMIEDHTPREWRVHTSANLQGSHLQGIATIVLGVNDVDSAAALFRRAYAWDAPLKGDYAEFGARLAHFPGTPVMLAAPLNRNSRLASRLAKFGEIPVGFLLQTDDIEQAAQRFHLTATRNWFGHAVAWFKLGEFEAAKLDSVKLDPVKLRGIALGVIQS
jgi:hypothetical protein